MKTEDTSMPRHAPFRIGMHLHGTTRTDPRVLREATALARAGFAVTVVDNESDGTRPRRETFNGITLVHARVPNASGMRWIKRNKATRLAWLLIQNIRALLALRVDAYHAHDANTLLAAYIAASVHRKPLVFDAHELPYAQGYFVVHHLQLKLYNALLRYIIPRCSAVITVSPPIADEIQQRYGGPYPVLVRNTPPYQPPITSNLLREQLQLPPQSRIALYQGNLQEDRELEVVVRAAKFLPDDVVIVLMGNGPSKGALETLIASEGVGEQVRILPAVPYAELLQWTASADLGLIIYPPNSSLNVRYCLPNKLFEYLMAGVPVLASSLDAVAEILAHYDIGEICRSLEPEAVAAAIASILTDQEGLTQLHANTLVAARELNWEVEQTTLLDLYNGVLHMRVSEARSEVVC